jgi:hypothetical protein
MLHVNTFAQFTVLTCAAWQHTQRNLQCRAGPPGEGKRTYPGLRIQSVRVSTGHAAAGGYRTRPL